MPRHHQFLKAIRQSSPENLATAAGTRAAGPGPPPALPDLDPELDGLPLGIPAGDLGVRPFALSAPDEVL